MAGMQAAVIVTSELREERLGSSLAAQQQNLNISFNRLQMTEILRSFYDSFHNTNYVLIVLYVVIIILALVANILVIIVVFKYQYMRSVTNYFVVNLSIADLLVTIICMPMAISQAVSIVWVYGELMCKLFFYLQGVAVAASVFTFTAMSIDRYLAIRRPIGFRRRFNRKGTIIVIGILWLVAFSIFIPVLQVVTLKNLSMDLGNITLAGPGMNGEVLEMLMPANFYVCSEDFKPLGISSHIFGIVYFITIYAVPGFIVIMAYSMMGRTLCARKPPFDCDSANSQQGFRLVRERRRVAWILLLLAGLFALCWLPYNVLRLLGDLDVIYEGDFLGNMISYFLFLGHANSALNPIVYCLMTRNFRRSVKEILCRNTFNLLRPRSQRKTVSSAAGVYGAGNKAVGVPGPHYPVRAYPGGSDDLDNPSSTKRLYAHRMKMTQPGSKGLRSPASHPALAGVHQRASPTTSSSGYDSLGSRHSPHRRCFVMKNLSQEQRQQQHKIISPVKKKHDTNEHELFAMTKPHRQNYNNNTLRSSSNFSPFRVHQSNRLSSSINDKRSTTITYDDQKFI